MDVGNLSSPIAQDGGRTSILLEPNLIDSKCEIFVGRTPSLLVPNMTDNKSKIFVGRTPSLLVPNLTDSKSKIFVKHAEPTRTEPD